MADRRKNGKKINSKISAVITCLIVFVLIFVGISLATDSKPTDSPVKTPDTEQTTEKTFEENSTKTPESSTNEVTNSTVPVEPSTNNSVVIKPEPTKPDTTKKPVSTGSFYDSVKYRSPDAVPADIFKHGRTLMLLNRQYELPENFKWDLVYWANGNSVDAMYLNCEEHNSVKAVDRAAYQPLKNMFADAEKAGVPLQLVSAYRSIYLQDKLFTRSVNSYISQGYSESEAINKANYSRTFSGTSEHNTGLGFDILERGNFTLSTSFENSAQFRWLMENAENYGFILRYAKDKTNETGIMYEPWHFRYVGVEHAKEINRLGLCLEEYIGYLEA
ncbi:MAG: D-alanyl-D-alanine carboxypeptidase family protein [Clostridia bacterium]|nr:D-alanyl-D-alanine carboxypeptidase family protein [Clostridia bacterium]